MSTTTNLTAEGVQGALNSVLHTGKSAIHALGPEEVRRFLESQPGVSRVSIENFRGSGEVGASSGIILFTATYDAGAGPVTRDLVLRHAPGSEKRLFFEYDLARQFKVQRALQGSGVPVPEPLWLDSDGRWLGVPGFVMARQPGVAPYPDAFTRGPIAEASAEDRQRMLEQIMAALVRVHSTDIEAAGLEDFAMNAPGEKPMERCINWYWLTWEWAHPQEYERLIPVHRWLLAHAPDGKPELIHGDSTLHNYLFHATRLTGVVDWEMSCLAYAEADLAMQCVGNQLFAAPPESGAPRPPSEEEWLALYYKAGGRPLKNFEYFKKFAAYTIVVALSSLFKHSWEESRPARERLLVPLWAQLEP